MSEQTEAILLKVDVDTSSIDRAIERVSMLMVGVAQLNQAIFDAGNGLQDMQPATAELSTFEDPTPAKLDELIAEVRGLRGELAAERVAKSLATAHLFDDSSAMRVVGMNRPIEIADLQPPRKQEPEAPRRVDSDPE